MAMMYHLTLQLDAGDWAAVQKAIARRQAMRDGEGAMLPPTESNTAGAYVAEICRGWLDDRDGRRAEDWLED